MSDSLKEDAKHYCEGIARGLVLWISGQDSWLLKHKNSDARCGHSPGNLTYSHVCLQLAGEWSQESLEGWPEGTRRLLARYRPDADDCEGACVTAVALGRKPGFYLSSGLRKRAGCLRAGPA